MRENIRGNRDSSGGQYIQLVPEVNLYGKYPFTRRKKSFVKDLLRKGLTPGL